MAHEVVEQFDRYLQEAGVAAPVVTPQPAPTTQGRLVPPPTSSEQQRWTRDEIAEACRLVHRAARTLGVTELGPDAADAAGRHLAALALQVFRAELRQVEYVIASMKPEHLGGPSLWESLDDSGAMGRHYALLAAVDHELAEVDAGDPTEVAIHQNRAQAAIQGIVPPGSAVRTTIGSLKERALTAFHLTSFDITVCVGEIVLVALRFRNPEKMDYEKQLQRLKDAAKPMIELMPNRALAEPTPEDISIQVLRGAQALQTLITLAPPIETLIRATIDVIAMDASKRGRQRKGPFGSVAGERWHRWVDALIPGGVAVLNEAFPPDRPLNLEQLELGAMLYFATEGWPSLAAMRDKTDGFAFINDHRADGLFGREARSQHERSQLFDQHFGAFASRARIVLRDIGVNASPTMTR